LQFVKDLKGARANGGVQIEQRGINCCIQPCRHKLVFYCK